MVVFTAHSKNANPKFSKSKTWLVKAIIEIKIYIITGTEKRPLI